MSIQAGNNANIKWIGVTSLLFGVLLIANHGNEILRQFVIVPDSVAESAVVADCRSDELEEENLSLRECQLMVSNVQIILASSPSWFRSVSICLYLLGFVSALLSLVFGMRFVSSPNSAQRPLRASLVSLVFIDLLIFVAATLIDENGSVITFDKPIVVSPTPVRAPSALGPKSPTAFPAPPMPKPEEKPSTQANKPSSSPTPPQ